MPGSSSAVARPIVDLLGKRLGAATILFHTAVADRMGIGITDAKCRSLLLELGPMSAGDIAERLGLTTGAVTGVIDRLVASRLVRRAADPRDRRRVVVELRPDARRDQEVAELFEPMGTRIARLVATYPERDQARIAAFLTAASEILEEEATRLRGGVKP